VNSDLRQVLISIEPPILATSLAAILESRSIDVVVWTERVEGAVRCDLAIVSGSPPEQVEASTVLSLPDIEGNSGVGLLRVNGDTRTVQIGCLGDLMSVVEEFAVA